MLKKLAAFPPRLDELYKRMIQQMSDSDDADTCRCVLASTAVLYRPVTIPELIALMQPLENLVNNLESVQEIVSLCRSFLTLRNDTVYFVHQSAKDFLLRKAYREIFPRGADEIHQVIFTRSLPILSSILRRDMFSLKEPGLPIKSISLPNPDPLGATRYSCVY